ncbi:hypothetical protein ABIC52_001070 [Curtobacterium oceanosedimentum]
MEASEIILAVSVGVIALISLSAAFRSGRRRD